MNIIYQKVLNKNWKATPNNTQERKKKRKRISPSDTQVHYSSNIENQSLMSSLKRQKTISDSYSEKASTRGKGEGSSVQYLFCKHEILSSDLMENARCGSRAL